MQYYDAHASEYFTFSSLPMPSSFYTSFFSLLPTHAAILDIGCGSGRDLKYFSENGYEAEGLDASASLCRLAREHSGCPVHCGDMLTWQPNRQYDGLWACASILHLSSDNILAFFRRVPIMLKPSGIMYASFKVGITTGEDEKGRYFTDFSQELLEQILQAVPELKLIHDEMTGDSLDRSGFRWRNLYFQLSR